MADKYTKLSPSKANEGTIIEDEDDADIQRCCGLFSIKTGFFLYGAMDILLFIVVTVFLIRSKVAGENEDAKWLLAIFLLQLPNFLLFVMVLIDDKS